MQFPKVLAVAVLGAGLAACAGERFASSQSPYYEPAPAGPKEAGGTAAGAIAGAVIGSQFGGGVGERVAAGVAGAAIGGLIGNRIGAALDDEDRQRAYAAQIDALERGNSGAPVGWENPDSGRRGTIVPGPAYDRRGTKCREFTHTVYIDGRPQIARGAACRNPDGTWTPLA